MELPLEVEEILSDDYEEGEILDGDNLYDEVSSLEEFSSSEEGERSQSQNNYAQVENAVPKDTIKQSTKCRRKDHKCKEDSVCRKERKGKHCYARIRKAKSSAKSKLVTETPLSNVERTFTRKPDVGPIIKHLKCRPSSPFKPRPDPPKVLHRYDYKDYHEKENRYINKRYWATPPKNKVKPTEKHVHIHHNRSKISKDNYYSKPRHHAAIVSPKGLSNETSKTDSAKSDSFSKTSLLKRLVGSGATGVKPIKENEPSVVFSKPEGVSEENKLGSDVEGELAIKQEEIEKAITGNDTEATINSIKEEKKTYESVNIQPLPEPPKKIELKWIRSMKEDKDELHLRVEALRSAWVKKFNDRKKRGLIHMKKSEGIDDFLEDFAFSSDIEEEKNEDTEAPKVKDDPAVGNTFPHFIATDISGDILKPEDMVIVSEKSSEEPIICETAVTASEGNSSVFVDPLFFSSEHYPQNASIPEVPNSNGVNLSTNDSIANINNSDLVSSEGIVLSENISSHKYLQNSSKSRLRKKWRKKRKSKGTTIDGTKNVANISTDLDEDVLRELALLSVKSKNRNSNSVNIRETDTNKNTEKELTTLPSQSGGKTFPKLCESESTGATSGDNWEDDLDEDILRARLLSSLTKQVSEESAKLERVTANVQKLFSKDMLITNKVSKPAVNLLKLPTTKKLIIKKLDKRKLRNSVTKKIWKQGNTCIRKPKLQSNIIANHFSKQTVFKKNDKALQNKCIIASSNTRPIPQVPQMIITLDDSDSSSDETYNTKGLSNLPKSEAISSDIEAKLDLLLREAELNSQLEKGVFDNPSVSMTDNKEDKNKLTSNENFNPSENLVVPETHQESNKSSLRTTPSSYSSNSIPTPQALKHLPAWQQEEYKRLKKKIAEKEKVLQVTRAKILEPNKDINANNSILIGEKACVNADVLLTAVNPLPNMTSSNGEQSVIFSNCSIKVATDDNQKKLEHTSNSEILSSPKVDVSNPSKTMSSEENMVKKSFPHLVSCSIMEEINVMNDIVNDFEKNKSEYMDLKEKTARLKRILKATESKMSVKKHEMFHIRDTITEKERQISSKIATFLMTSSSPNKKLKPPNRDMELVKLKYKEVSLRAQFLFHDFLSEKVQGKNEKKTVDSIKNPELKVKETAGVKRTSESKETAQFKKHIAFKDSVVVKNVLPADKAKGQIEALKRNFSAKEREREEWDPNTPVCHYDLNGICRDEECQYQHFKTV